MASTALWRPARPGLRWRLEEGADVVRRDNRGVEDRVLAELGVGGVQHHQIAGGGPLCPETWAQLFRPVESDRDTNGTQAPIFIEIAGFSCSCLLLRRGWPLASALAKSIQ